MRSNYYVTESDFRRIINHAMKLTSLGTVFVFLGGGAITLTYYSVKDDMIEFLIGGFLLLIASCVSAVLWKKEYDEETRRENEAENRSKERHEWEMGQNSQEIQLLYDEKDLNRD